MKLGKCPDCGKFLTPYKNGKLECVFCGFQMKVPLVKIYREGPPETIMDKTERRKKNG